MAEQIQVGGVRAVFDQVRIPIGLVLDQVELVGQKADVLIDPLRLQMPEPAIATVFVSPGSLEAYLNEQAPGGLRDFAVSLRPGLIDVQATARVIVELRATASCKLVIKDERTLNVELVSVDVLGGSAKSLVESQLDKINPILDAQDLPIQLALKKVEITASGIYVTGELSP